MKEKLPVYWSYEECLFGAGKRFPLLMALEEEASAVHGNPCFDGTNCRPKLNGIDKTMVSL